MQNTISIKLSNDEIKTVKKVLLSLQWFESPIENEYVDLRMKNNNGSVATLYTSGKLVFQGEQSFNEEVLKIRGQKEGVSVDHIGVDEVGKGDYFGPLVVVGCFVNKEFADRVLSLGFGDSKNFSDTKIMEFYNQVKNYPYYYPSIVMPEEYNTLIDQIGNASILLAKQHSKVIEMGLKDLKDKGIVCNHAVIDQFSLLKSRVENEMGELGKKVVLEQYHKGESDIAVASASILARGIFLEKIEEMSRRYSFRFPKGSSNVINSAREFVKKYGEYELRRVAKVSFKITKKVLILA